DFISGGAQSNYLYGDAGNDTIISSGGGDVLGRDAEDLLPTATNPLPGWVGNDSLDGSGGPDTLLAQRGADIVIGGTGTDLLDARGNDDSLPDRANDEIRPAEQVFIGTPAVIKTI